MLDAPHRRHRREFAPGGQHSIDPILHPGNPDMGQPGIAFRGVQSGGCRVTLPRNHAKTIGEERLDLEMRAPRTHRPDDQIDIGIDQLPLRRPRSNVTQDIWTPEASRARTVLKAVKR